MINIKLVYMDGKDVVVNLKNEQFATFFECLNKGKVYWDDEAKSGFWTNLSEIRFIQFLLLEDANEPKAVGNSENAGSGDGCGNCEANPVPAADASEAGNN